MEKLKCSRRNRPDLFDSSEGMKFVVLYLAAQYVKFRAERGDRKINGRDRQAYFHHLNNIVSDLYAAWRSDPKIYVGYSRGKRNFLRGGCYWDFKRDKALLSQRIYLDLIDSLAERGYIENHTAPSGRNRYSSRMRAEPRLIEQLQAKKVTWAGLRTDISKSAIIVKDENKKTIPPPNDNSFDLEQAEANLQRINENLQTSLLNLDITDEKYEALRTRMRQRVDDEEDSQNLESPREPLEFSNRSLRRIFVLSGFAYGGRFYGGWWQGLPKKYRKHIEIEGCITVEMDYSTMQCRVLYAKAKADPPPDSYIVPGWDEELREVTKKAFNQLLNSSEGSRHPNQWHRFAPNIEPSPKPEDWGKMSRHQRAKLRREEFQKRTGREYKELLHDLKQMHTPIDQFFFSQSWKWLQRIDSDIAEKVMLKLLDQKYTALPIHDSFIVRRGAEDALLEAMDEAFNEIIGVKGKVDRNATVYDGVGARLVHQNELHDDLRKSLIERKGYHQRDDEWKSVWGLEGYE